MKGAQLAATVTLAVLAPWATAEPVGIAYAWRFGEVSLNAAGRGPITLSSGLSDDSSTVTVSHGNGTVSLTLAAPGTVVPAPGGDASGYLAQVPLGAFRSETPPGQTGNNVFGFTATAYLRLELMDLASGQTESIGVAAGINGNVEDAGASYSASGWAPTEYTSYLAGVPFHLQDVSPTPVWGDGSPSTMFATLSFGWWAGPSDSTPTDVPTAPEPSALLLSLGLLAGSAALRRRLNRA